MLDRALDCGIKEYEFWDMTIGELERAVASAVRMERQRAQQQATYDYILANLIIKGVGKVLGDKSAYPPLEEAYPGVFDDIAQEQQEKLEEQKMNLSALRFKQFAQSYNERFNNKEVLEKINE